MFCLFCLLSFTSVNKHGRPWGLGAGRWWWWWCGGRRCPAGCHNMSPIGPIDHWRNFQVTRKAEWQVRCGGGTCECMTRAISRHHQFPLLVTLTTLSKGICLMEKARCGCRSGRRSIRSSETAERVSLAGVSHVQISSGSNFVSNFRPFHLADEI